MIEQTGVTLSIMTAEEYRTTTTEIEEVFPNKALALNFINKQEESARKLVEINQSHKIIIIAKWKTIDPDGFFVTGEKVIEIKGRYFKRD